MSKVLLISGSIFALQGTAFANRITAPNDPRGRCADRAMADDVCQNKRAKALRSGCVTQDEYNTLVGFGSYALCDYDVDPAALGSWCPCGCFDQNVNILTVDTEGSYSWSKAGDVSSNWKNTKVAALSTDSSLEKITLQKRGLKLATKGPETIPLYVIKTAYGKGLRLTSEHPVLLSDGTMIQARKLQVGQALLGADGKAKKVTGITRELVSEDVVNFAVEGDNKKSHIIVAEGVLVGDLMWQGLLSEEEKALEIRN